MCMYVASKLSYSFVQYGQAGAGRSNAECWVYGEREVGETSWTCIPMIVARCTDNTSPPGICL